MAELSRTVEATAQREPHARRVTAVVGVRLAALAAVGGLLAGCGGGPDPAATASPVPTHSEPAQSTPDPSDASGTSTPEPTVVAQEPDETPDPADLVPAEDLPGLIGTLADGDIAWELPEGDLIDLPSQWDDTTAELIAAGAGWEALAGMWTLDGESAFESEAILYVSVIEDEESASTSLENVVDEFYLPGYEASGLAVASFETIEHPRGYDAVQVELRGTDASLLVNGSPVAAHHTLVVVREGSRELALEFLRYGSAPSVATPDEVADVVASFAFDEG